MEKKDSAFSPTPHGSDSPLGSSSPQKDPRSEVEPEGIFAEEDDAVEAEVVEPTAPQSSPVPPKKNEADGEGIDLDTSAFEAGDPAQALNFAPDGEQELPDPDGSDANLAFGDLKSEPAPVEPDAPKVVHKKVVRYERGGVVKGFSAAIIYLILVISAGVLSAYIAISVANDIFAFTKDDSVYELTIDDPDMSLGELADYLQEEGIIRYPFIFKTYVSLKQHGKSEQNKFKLNAGTYSVSPSYNYDKIINCLDPAPVRAEISITFSEGLTVDDIIDICVEKGIGTRAGFVDAIQNYDFSDYWFLKDLTTSDDRFYRLEGYLYPDTYRFYTDSSEVAVLTKMLNNFAKKVPDTYADRCTELGLTLDQAVILASMIESECARINDLEYVSAVFHNRMKSSSFNGLLGSDATIQYYLRHTTGERKPTLTEADLQIDSPYNTRLNRGLPPGAICNPSLNALMAAVYPNTECGYYYFVAQKNGYNLYAKTLSEHNKNVAQVKSEG